MEYNELIARVQQASLPSPETDALMRSVRQTLQRRDQRRRTVLSSLFLLLACVAIVLPLTSTQEPQELMLAERVSRSLNARPNELPAPLLGYQHSIYNRQIYTLI